MKEVIKIFTLHLFTQSATLMATVNDAGVALRLYDVPPGSLTMSMFLAMQERRIASSKKLIHVGQKTDKQINTLGSPFTETYPVMRGTRVQPPFRLAV